MGQTLEEEVLKEDNHRLICEALEVFLSSGAMTAEDEIKTKKLLILWKSLKKK